MIEKLLKASREIEQRAFGLLHPETVFQEVCENFQSMGNYDLAALQLICPAERIIETVCGTGEAVRLVGRARHTLENHEPLQDIQVAIALADPPRAEILAGNDDRFDDWLFKTFKQIDWLRVFVPVILVRDQSGHVVEGAKLEEWMRRWRIGVLEDIDDKDRRKCPIEFRLPTNDGWTSEVIGTIEVAYTDRRGRAISSKQAVDLTKHAAELAPKIHRVLLPSVLQCVAEHACQVLAADYASLHFDYDASEHRYIYEVTSGEVQRILASIPPRESGLGRQAIEARKPCFIPDPRQNHADDQLRKTNPRLYDLGIRAMAAIPLSVTGKEGVLYFGFENIQEFDEQQSESLQFFASLAGDAIGHAMMFTQVRERGRLLESIHSVTESLVRTPKDNLLLQRIAWDSLNILAADVVTIYEYYQRQDRFKTPPVIAGRLLHKQKMVTEIDPEDVPALLVKHAQPVFETNSPGKHDVLNPKRNRPAHKGEPFPVRERIKSAAAIPLKVDEEIVGLMFINYRRPHPFPDDEKKLILTLASTAAIAIRNRRLLEELQATDIDIVATLDLKQFLDGIVQRAVSHTGAQVAEIHLLELPAGKLVLRAQHGETSNAKVMQARLNDVVRQVAERRESVLVRDLQADTTSPAARIGSSIGVPLLDKQQRLLGVLAVGHTKGNVFQRFEGLEQLAVKAVIAIQSADRQSKLVASESIATLGHLAATSLHKAGNDLGAIHVFAQMLEASETITDNDRNIVEDIKNVTDEIYEEIGRLKTWKEGQRKLLDLGEVLNDALKRVTRPNGIYTEVKMPDELPQIVADEGQLIEVLVNLFDNAVKAMGEKGGRLEIGGKESVLLGQHWVLLSITDTGKGIKETLLDSVGQRGHTTSSRGLGLGSWLARAYIEKLGGKIEWKSKRGEGTTVTIALPTDQPTSADHEVPNE